MTYQVLARKWRPRDFSDMVGQEHVLKALFNGLAQGRLHHAYLFTGTRGVGKTTLARIIAKCINCEQGMSATPCGTCDICIAVEQGRFVDLIEIDAASNTKVENTREIIDNVPYAPTQGRYKVYLIDEVHMLSGHSFNALLKTLEEPPEHVKFLLATTDPERLPITILSRCLQFNLKALSPTQIQQRLEYILQAEALTAENEALNLLAHAANGSMRDALSLLDQAIAFGAGAVTVTDVRTMLGSIEPKHILGLLAALQTQDVPQLMALSQQIAEQAADFSNALEELLTLLHRIALVQMLPALRDDDPLLAEQLATFAQQFSPETIQLYYQIGLIGRRDLPLAPSPRTGFEMILLRMLTFSRTNPITIEQKPLTAITPEITPKAITPKATTTKAAQTTQNWPDILSHLALSGLAYTLASHCTMHECTETQITLHLDNSHAALLNDKLQARIEETLQQYYGKPIKLTININKADSASSVNSPARQKKLLDERNLEHAVSAIENDANVQAILNTFDGNIITHSIKANPDTTN